MLMRVCAAGCAAATVRRLRGATHLVVRQRRATQALLLLLLVHILPPQHVFFLLLLLPMELPELPMGLQQQR